MFLQNVEETEEKFSKKSNMQFCHGHSSNNNHVTRNLTIKARISSGSGTDFSMR
jgi:hypothetical protein